MIEVALTKGFVARVDDSAAQLVSRYSWCARQQVASDTVYAVTTVYTPEKREIKMHRLITSAPLGLHVDHIDGDGLNNTYANLRLCSRSENMRNRKTNKGCAYKGVRRLGNRFQARIFLNGKHLYLGCFATPIEAALAYDEAAAKIYGEFARMNMPAQAENA